jgi:hypothetical protein
VPSSPERRVNSHNSATGWTCTKKTTSESVRNSESDAGFKSGLQGLSSEGEIVYDLVNEEVTTARLCHWVIRFRQRSVLREIAGFLCCLGCPKTSVFNQPTLRNNP